MNTNNPLVIGPTPVILYGNYQYNTGAEPLVYKNIPTPLFWKVSDHKPTPTMLFINNLNPSEESVNPKINKLSESAYEMIIPYENMNYFNEPLYTSLQVANIYYSYESSSFQNNLYIIYFTKDIWVTFIVNNPTLFTTSTTKFFTKRGFVSRDLSFPLTSLISRPELYNFNFTNKLSTLDYNLLSSVSLLPVAPVSYTFLGVPFTLYDNMFIQNTISPFTPYKYVLFKNTFNGPFCMYLAPVLSDNYTGTEGQGYFFNEYDLSYLNSDVLEVIYLPFSPYWINKSNFTLTNISMAMRECPPLWVNFYCFNLSDLAQLSQINTQLSEVIGPYYGSNPPYTNSWIFEPYIKREWIRLYFVNAEAYTFIDWMYFIPNMLTSNLGSTTNLPYWFLGFNENGVNIALMTYNNPPLATNNYLQLQNSLSPLNFPLKSPAISLTNGWTNYYSTNRQYYNASNYQAKVAAQNAAINANVVANSQSSNLVGAIEHSIMNFWNPMASTQAIYTGVNVPLIDSIATNSAKAAQVEANFMNQGIKTDLGSQTSLNNASSQIDSVNKGSAMFQIFQLPSFYISQIWAYISKYGYLLNKYMTIPELINRVNYNYIELIEFTSSFFSMNMVGFSTSDLLYLEHIFTKGIWLWNNPLLLTNEPWSDIVIETNVEISNE